MVVNLTVQRSKSSSPTFLFVPNAYLVHPSLVSATGVVVNAGGEETCVLTHAHVLGRVRALGPVLGRGLGLHGIAEGAILMNLPGMVDTVEGAEVGLGLVQEVDEVPAVDIVNLLGLVLRYVAGLLGLHADGRQVTSVEVMEGAERGRLHTLCVPVAHGRDLTLVHVLALRVLARGRAPCLTLPTRNTVGAEAGVPRVLDPRVVGGGATARMISETVVAGRSRLGCSYLYPSVVHFPRVI